MRYFNFKPLMFCLLFILFLGSGLQVFADKKEDSYLSYDSKLNNIKQEKSSIHKKVQAAKKQERLAIARLQSTQRELHKHKSNYLSTQRRIQDTITQLEESEQKHAQLEIEAQEKAKELKAHLHQLYIKKTNILSAFIDSLLNSHSVTEFLNTLYYQKKLIQQEMSLIKGVQKQQKEIRQIQASLTSKRLSLENNREAARKLQRVVHQKKQEQHKLVNRLRKERLAYEVAERQLERESNKLTRKIIDLTKGGKLDLSDLVNNHYLYPCSARVTSPYGYRRHPIFGVRSFHSGIDLGARYNTPVKASNGGIVIYAGWYSGYGKTVIVSHGQKKSTLYAHLTSIKTSVGKKVAQGSIVGNVGSTGYSTGPHLHFEYRTNGKTQNPINILSR